MSREHGLANARALLADFSKPELCGQSLLLRIFCLWNLRCSIPWHSGAARREPDAGGAPWVRAEVLIPVAHSFLVLQEHARGMFDFLTGSICLKRPTELVVGVGGIGYRLFVPLSTSERLPDSGEVTLKTYLHVREDGLKLYGFGTEAEREMFLLLISVAGVGPGTALAALSGSSVEQLREVITMGDVSALTRIKGIGKKTAQRIVVDLREAVERIPGAGAVPVAVGRQNIEDTLQAMISLGYTRNVAASAVRKAVEALGHDAATEALLREALRHL